MTRINNQTVIMVAIIAAVIQATFGMASSVHAGQTGSSYFENSSPTLTWTGSSSLPATGDRCVPDLQGYVIPNNTTKNWANSPGHECDGTGAVGDMRMKQVSADPNILNDRREGFYQILYYNYHSGDAWEKAGASQVALSLLGYGFGSGGGTGAGHGRSISSAEWTDLHNRITAPDIEMMWTSRSCPAGSTWCIPGGAPFQYNTAGVITNGKYDAIRVDNGASHLNVDAWIFRSKSNPSNVYGIYEIECGNGLGNVTGLPAYTPTYDLSPSITSVSPGVTEIGSKVTVKSQIKYSGNSATRPTQWQINQIIIRPNGLQPSNRGGGVSSATDSPCEFYGKPSIDCGGFGANGSGVYSGTTVLPVYTSPVLDYPVGTEVCYGLSVQPRSYVSDEWIHSSLECILIGVRPKVQVWGSDLRTRGGIETGTALINSGGVDKLFGSWVEYGGFAAVSISGFASGSGLNGGNVSVDGTDPGNVWNKLTFANIDNSGNTSYGKFALPANLPTITDQFIGSTSGSFDGGSLSGLASGSYDAGSGSITIDASTVGQEGAVGKTIIIVSSGTVSIAGNIVYERNGASQVFTDVRQISQVIIIARTINITGAVSQIDSWLLTTSSAGMVNTCSDVPLNASLNSNVCSTVLTVNGPVVTSHLYLRRTGGSESVANAGSPAEIFNLRPDAYIWAYGRASQSGKAQTAYSVELPPRF